MNRPGCLKKILSFKLPPKGILEPNGPDDPLDYYYSPTAGFLYRTRIKQALSLLHPPYDSVLEIGYGSGVMMPTLASMGREVSGIDIRSDPQKVAANLSKLGIHPLLLKADICQAQFQAGSFDLVVAISVLEHIRDLAGVISRIHFLLRPQGHFLVGMPKTGSFMQALFYLIGYKNIKKEHVTSYKELLSLSGKYFTLANFAKIPAKLPEFACLYFNMLFVKQ